MHIRQLRLQNIACFEDVTLDFTDEDGKPCRWVVLLGENGTGKSTALQAVPFLLPSVFDQSIPFWRNWIREGYEIGSSSIVAGSDLDDRYQSQASSFDLSAMLSGGVRIERDVPSPIREFLESKDVIVGGWFAAGYRAWRGGRRIVDSSTEPTSYALPAPKADRFASLFDDYSRTTSIREWLADLDYRQLKETGAQKRRAKEVFDLAVRAIEGVFPDNRLRFVEITPTKDVIFEEDGLRVSIESLSDGYRSAMNWIGDLVRRLVEAFPDSKNPLHEYGVVLVDEIDLHLHPKWQRTIVQQIRSVFPNLQFIVTTHSPFIAQDMTERDKLIVLKREGNKVTATEDKGFVQGWRVDQILTSYLFGLNSTRGTDVEQAERSRADLLTAEAKRSLTDDERKRLSEINGLLAKVKSEPGEHAGQNGDAGEAELQQAADSLLSLLAERLPKLPEAA